MSDQAKQLFLAIWRESLPIADSLGLSLTPKDLRLIKLALVQEWVKEKIAIETGAAPTMADFFRMYNEGRGA